MVPDQCKAARKSLGLQFHELAKLAGVASGQISGFEAGTEILARDLTAIRSVLESSGITFPAENDEGTMSRCKASEPSHWLREL